MDDIAGAHEFQSNMGNEIHVEQRHLSETNFERWIRQKCSKKRIEFQFQVLTNTFTNIKRSKVGK